MNASTTINLEKEFAAQCARLRAAIDPKLLAAHGLIDSLEEFILRGGKRIRPRLVLLGYQLSGKTPPQGVIDVAVAMEFIHAFFLIHDDIMDRSDTRRGKPTVHKLYEQNGDANYGIAMAILVGDLAYTTALGLVANAAIADDKKTAVLQKMTAMVTATIAGQAEDMEFERRKQVTSDEILRMYTLKTAQYTFEAPFSIGALLGGCDDAVLAALTQFAIPMGIAFQIQDDLLGAFGDPAETGKPVGADIVQGKKTLLIAEAYARATADQKQRLMQALGNPQASPADIQGAQKIIEETGAMVLCKEKILAELQHADQALLELEREIESPVIAELRSLTDKLRDRRT